MTVLFRVEEGFSNGLKCKCTAKILTMYPTHTLRKKNHSGKR